MSDEVKIKPCENGWIIVYYTYSTPNEVVFRTYAEVQLWLLSHFRYIIERIEGKK